jgi:hypothetical protein
LGSERGYDRQAAEEAVRKAESILRELEEFCERNFGYAPTDTDEDATSANSNAAESACKQGN